MTKINKQLYKQRYDRENKEKINLYQRKRRLLKRDEINKKRREYLKRTNNATTHKYEKTKNGFLMRLYRNMQSRVTGVQKQKWHLYQGLSILSRQEFYNWAKNHEEFHRLFGVWESSDHMRKLCPTVNRIDSSKGYEINNMEWLTHSENSRLGTLSKHYGGSIR